MKIQRTKDFLQLIVDSGEWTVKEDFLRCTQEIYTIFFENKFLINIKLLKTLIKKMK